MKLIIKTRDIVSSIRKPMAKPTKVFQSRKKRLLDKIAKKEIND